MTFNRLLTLSIGLSIGAAAALVALCTLADPFYLFGRRPEPGANVAFYDNERLFKYWLAQDFVPGAYDTVILGPSYAASLDPAKVSGGESIYNLSFRGANAGEMLVLGDAVSRPGSQVKTAFLCLDPYVVQSLKARTDDMNPRTRRMAILSWPVLSHFVQRWLFPLNPHAKFFTRQGAHNEYAYREGKDSSVHIAEELRALHGRFAAPFRVKEGAVKKLAQLVADLRGRGVRTIGFLPPKPRALRELKAAHFEVYRRETLPLFGALDRFEDFEGTASLGDEYFVDAGGHLSELGSRWLLERLQRLKRD